MRDFGIFKESVDLLADDIAQAKAFDCHQMDETKWALLKRIFAGIKVMATDISLVGNSKVMHHLLPNLIPPIDREYTLWYLRENNTIENNLDWEWLLMREFIEEFFIPVISNKGFEEKAAAWLGEQEKYSWDTSMMKIVDNLIIGAKIFRRLSLERMASEVLGT